MAENIRSKENIKRLLGKLKAVKGSSIDILFDYEKESIPLLDCPEPFKECGLPTDLLIAIHDSLGSREYTDKELKSASARIKRQISAGNFRKKELPEGVIVSIAGQASELSDKEFLTLVKYLRDKGTDRSDERKCLEFRLAYPQINYSETYARMVFRKGRSKLANQLVDLSDCCLEDREGNDVSEEIRLRIEAPIAYMLVKLNRAGKNPYVYVGRGSRVITFNLDKTLKDAIYRLEMEPWLLQEYPPPTSRKGYWEPSDVERLISAGEDIKEANRKVYDWFSKHV